MQMVLKSHCWCINAGPKHSAHTYKKLILKTETKLLTAGTYVKNERERRSEIPQWGDTMKTI